MIVSDDSSEGNYADANFPSKEISPTSPTKRARPNLSVDTSLANEEVTALIAKGEDVQKSNPLSSDRSKSSNGSTSTRRSSRVAANSSSSSSIQVAGGKPEVSPAEGRRSKRLKVKDEDGTDGNNNNSDNNNALSLLDTSRSAGGGNNRRPPLHSGPSSVREYANTPETNSTGPPTRRRTLSSLATIAQEFLPQGQLSDRSPGEWQSTDAKFSGLDIRP
jgi:hypothetical protein